MYPSHSDQKGNILVVIIIFVLLVATGVGAYYLGTAQSKKVPNQESFDKAIQDAINNPQPIASPIQPNTEAKDFSWKTYIKDDFSFSYPPEATVTELSDGSIILSFKEPLPSGVPDGYELSPGYRINFKINQSGEKTLREVANKEFEQIKEYGFITKPLSDTKVGKVETYSGLTFSGGAQVNSTYIYLTYVLDSYLKISYSINDVNNKGYEQEVNKIISSIEVYYIW